MKHILLSFFSFITAFASTDTEKITIWMIGDSTMSIKEKRVFPEMGWGMPFAGFFDSTVRVENHAKNGRSTRSFIEEGLWDKVNAGMKKGDYLFVQFGHNDEAKEKTERYTTPEQYKANLEKFYYAAKEKGVKMVLLTPVSRRKFKEGKQLETHQVYSALVKDFAANHDVHFINLDTKSRELYQKIGEEPSKLLFLQLEAGEHPNYPEGKVDNTHFTELGARKVAQIVLAEIRNLDSNLANRVIKPVKK